MLGQKEEHAWQIPCDSCPESYDTEQEMKTQQKVNKEQQQLRN